MNLFTRIKFTSMAVLIIGSTATTSGAADLARPNIIYIYADDLGYGETGPYGQKKIHTPNIDKLAAEGMKFTRHYTGTPVCAPARCNLLTGLHSGHAVVRGNYEMGGYEDDKEGGQMPLPPHTVTIGNVLQKAGYATGCVGKWGLGMSDTAGAPNRQGFDYFFGYLDQKQAHNFYPTHLWENDKPFPLKNQFLNVHENRGSGGKPVDFAKYQTGDHAVDHMTSKALDFISGHKDGPFFLYFATPLPHLSLQPKKEFYDRYVKEFPDDPPYYGQKGYAAVEHPRAAYAAMISMMDDQVGQVVKKVKELGLDDNTIIMFSSDNGPTFDAGGVDTEFFNSAADLRGRKTDVYEGGIREPMIARWPGHIAEGSTTDLRSAQYDVLPTIADLLHITLTKPYDGISFLPTLLGKGEQKQHDFMYWEFPEHGGHVALTKMPWKIVRMNVRKNPNAAWELYNLESDPDEKTDVSAQHPEIVKELEALAVQSHWHPIAKEFEFIDPKFDAKEKDE
jgi:arylsulfatase A-like enzyme